MSEKLFFHLRGYRKRAALSQQELGELLGYSTDTIVSRYENRVRSVTLENALRFEAVFQAPVSELFSDHYAKVELAVINRARAMHAAIECQGCSHCNDCLKRVFLEHLINRVPAPAPPSIWTQKRNTRPSSR